MLVLVSVLLRRLVDTSLAGGLVCALVLFGLRLRSGAFEDNPAGFEHVVASGSLQVRHVVSYRRCGVATKPFSFAATRHHRFHIHNRDL